MQSVAGVGRRLLGAIAAAALAACSYDWSIPQEASGSDAATDGSTRPDGAGTDASQDGAADVVTPGSDSGGMGPMDTGTSMVDAPPSCATLTQQLLQARAAAISCNEMGSMPCATTVTDECGCQVAVGGAGANTTSFENAVAAFEAAGCSTGGLCPGTCSTPTHVCLAVDGGASYACYQ
jgi:hypothetical protein